MTSRCRPTNEMKRVIMLVPDAYGGRGGIALYNRQFIQAVCQHSAVGEVVALPRTIPYPLETLPVELDYRTEAVGGKIRFIAEVLKLAIRGGKVDLVICSHLHLLPLAMLLARRFACPMVPLTYGVEAWKPTPHLIVNFLCRRLKGFISIRKLTANRLRSWAGIPDATFHYLPNCINLDTYGLGPKRSDLIKRYGLELKTVVMTVGRMDDTYFDRNKGFDEMLEVMPLLIDRVPQAVYLIMGDGNDRPRLEEKARDLGVADRVMFTGYVKEEEKADHYRLADVVAMPGRNTYHDRYPFRFAFLEPLACGVPVVGSRLEDESERDDPEAKALLIQVDPDDGTDILRGILEGLNQGSGSLNPALRKFDYPNFEQRTHAILDQFFGSSG